MKPLIFILVIITSFSITSCENNENPKPNITTGVYGTIKYGEGDCMPVINESARIYTNYNGEIYFIIKADLDNLGTGNFEQLKLNSIHSNVKNGVLAIELPVNTYVVMPKNFYDNSNLNTITIKKETVLNSNFKFWKCTSY
ncbi:hypothetical protein [Flavobacterium alvei]|uniref:hypothetical protein n=1 Tax=Flavobacterium alvei TaxID=2080416 RepID=UPI0026F091C3|nr:hypothetical protein [Flavobacterium alvei]